MARRLNPVKLSEKSIERTCTMLLSLDGWRILKTDPVSNPAWGKGFGELGMADTLCVRYFATSQGDPEYCALSEVLWIEWKSRTGRRKEHQKEWQERERARGALVVCAGVEFPKTIEGFADWYARSGLQRKSFSLAARQFNEITPEDVRRVKRG